MSRWGSRRRRLLWGAVAAVLLIGPLAFNLSRESSFTASIELFPRALSPYPAIDDPNYYRALFADPELRRQMDLNVGEGVTDYDDVRIDRVPGRLRLVLRAESDTPEKSVRVANALAAQIAGATRRRLALLTARDLEALRARLAETAPGRVRRSLRRGARRLERFGELPPVRVLPGAAAQPPELERWADRVVDDLPGDFRGRPDPLWSALAGLLAAATLWGICLVLFPPKRP